MKPVLLLSSQYEPIFIVSWKRAITLLYLDKIEVLDYHKNVEVHSSNRTFKVPSVVKLTTHAPFRVAHASFCKRSVFARDKYTCQYCRIRFHEKDLTYDHVYPRKRGGDTSWTNVTTCCYPCNQKKGDKTPKEAGMPLLHPPTKPKQRYLWVYQYVSKVPDEWSPFLPGLEKLE